MELMICVRRCWLWLWWCGPDRTHCLCYIPVSLSSMCVGKACDWRWGVGPRMARAVWCMHV